MLPALLTSGALCAVTHLRVEWHLNSLPPEKRLQGVALKHAVRSIMSAGCPTASPAIARHLDFGEAWPRAGKYSKAPRLAEPQDSRGRTNYVVEHEEYRPLNFGGPVPGLLEEAMRYQNGALLGAFHRSVGEHQLEHGGVRLGVNYNLTLRKPRPGTPGHVGASVLYTTMDDEGSEKRVARSAAEDGMGWVLPGGAGGGG